MTSSLQTAATTPDLTGPIALAVLIVAAWRLLAAWLFPYGPCRHCHGTGKHRSGTYWRPCRRCQGTGRRIRTGRRIWNWTRNRH